MMKRLAAAFILILPLPHNPILAQQGQPQIPPPAGSFETGSTWLGGEPVTWGPTGVSINDRDPWHPPEGTGEIGYGRPYRQRWRSCANI